MYRLQQKTAKIYFVNFPKELLRIVEETVVNSL